MFPIQKLTPSEEIIMKAIWSYKKKPVMSDILRQVNEVYGKGWKPQTVSTFLAKLCRKEYIEMSRNGRAFEYKALVKEREYQKYKLKMLLIFMYNDKVDYLQDDLKRLIEK